MSEIVGTYTVTEDEERFDRIARSIYGDERGGAVERLLDANPGTAEKLVSSGGWLPFGNRLRIPERPEPRGDTYTRPWE